MLSRLVVSPSDVRHYLTIFEKDGKNAMAFLQDFALFFSCSIQQYIRFPFTGVSIPIGVGACAIAL